MHKLLRRQLKRFFKGQEPPADLEPLLEAVEAAYRQSDHDRSLLEHSLDLTSQELVERNQRLREELAEHKATTEALRESEERYQLAVHGADVGIWDWDITTNTVYYSPRWKVLLGYREEQFGTTMDAWFRRVHPDDQEALQAALDAHLKGGTSHFEHEYRVRHKDGHYLWFVTRGLALWDEGGEPYRIAGSHEDVTDRRLVEDQLRHDAIHDTLTGLPNRTLLMDRLEHLATHADWKKGAGFAVLFLDLDRFKLINDSLGHLFGDQLLIQVAKRLRQAIPATDTLARLGGDEFVVLQEEVLHPEDTLLLAEQLLNCFHLPIQLNGHEVYTNASIGIALSTDSSLQPEELLRNADTAMYRAKAGGKGCYQVFDRRMHEKATARLRLENDLRRALEQEQFIVHYQPIFNLATGPIIGFEALARWDHPQQGLLSPASFIPVAEEIGLITQLDRWMLQESCRQLAQWRQQFCTGNALSIHVNVSARHFDAPGLSDTVGRTLEETRLPGHCLHLELTETALVQFERREVEAELYRLKKRDVRIYLDDFGTGYASLNYLHRLPFDGLKVDRSFIQGIDEDDRKKAFVRTIFHLAGSLNLATVIEGIETQAQLQTVRAMEDCNGQGWFFAPALPVDKIEALLREQTGGSPLPAQSGP